MHTDHWANNNNKKKIRKASKEKRNYPWKILWSFNRTKFPLKNKKEKEKETHHQTAPATTTLSEEGSYQPPGCSYDYSDI